MNSITYIKSIISISVKKIFAIDDDFLLIDFFDDEKQSIF